ncbi:22899_t:CDS:2 [Gigaspora margarita]|uniref:22899_t:CDS:1 n=1 Tax=Gigaspora margarita TaxID=4874 RepID=A0ABN7V3F4_GIGMA|nr:22899_t:CDS:2 [Gigaspora margarita]
MQNSASSFHAKDVKYQQLSEKQKIASLKEIVLNYEQSKSAVKTESIVEYIKLPKEIITEKRLCKAFDDAEDWCWQMYDNNNLHTNEYIVLIPKHNDQSDTPKITIVDKTIGTRHIYNKFWPSKKKLMITTLLLIITIAKHKSVINVNTNCPKLIQIMEQNGEIPNYLAESRTRQELVVYLASLNTVRILKYVQLKFTIIANEDRCQQNEIQPLCLEFILHKFNQEHPQICFSNISNFSQ